MSRGCVECGYAEGMHGASALDVGMVAASVCVRYRRPKFSLLRWLRGGS